MYREYLCMDCENYMKCPCNSGIETNFLKDYESIWLPEKQRYFIKVHNCEKFIQKDKPEHETLEDCKDNIRYCRFCGEPFQPDKHNKKVCGNPKCKWLMINTRKSRR